MSQYLNSASMMSGPRLGIKLKSCAMLWLYAYREGLEEAQCEI